MDKLEAKSIKEKQQMEELKVGDSYLGGKIVKISGYKCVIQ